MNFLDLDDDVKIIVAKHCTGDYFISTMFMSKHQDVCMYVCMYVCIYVRVCVYVCMYICMYVYTYVCVYVCMYICMQVAK
jgi:hypothetical protein